VTDGDPRVLRNKVTALGLDAFVDGAIYTRDEGDTAGKPNLRGFVRLLEATRASTNEVVYVGDNPTKDFIGVNSIGGRTVRVLEGPYRALPAPTEQHAPTVRVDRLRDCRRCWRDSASVANAEPPHVSNTGPYEGWRGVRHRGSPPTRRALPGIGPQVDRAREGL
jgi:hypothetical protein